MRLPHALLITLVCLNVTTYAQVVSSGVKVPLGKVGDYEQVIAIRVEGERVKISHKDGFGYLNLAQLSPEQKKLVLEKAPKEDMKARAEADLAKAFDDLLTRYADEYGGRASFKILQVQGDSEGSLVSDVIILTNKKVVRTTYETRRRYVLGSANFGRDAEYSEERVAVKTTEPELKSIPGDVGFVVGGKADWTDGMRTEVELYPYGAYSYITRLDIRKTVPRFTTNKIDGLMYYLESIATDKDDISKFLLEMAPNEEAKLRMKKLLDERKKQSAVPNKSND